MTKKLLSLLLAVALGLSWLWFWTVLTRPADERGRPSEGGSREEVRVWVDELVGSPEESFYYELADCWNSTQSGARMKMTVMSHAGYESKLRIALASGQPPDVCLGGFEALESLQYSGKAADLAVEIPEEFFPRERLDAMGPATTKAMVRNGRPTQFPIYRYCYGGVILANREMLAVAGFDDEKIRREGWTFDQFREASKRMTRDTDGDGKPDVWGFGAALSHLNHLFLNEFGPGVWGKEVQNHTLLGFDQATGRWGIHPLLTEEKVAKVFTLFVQLLNQDKTWSPDYLGMDWNEINDDLIVRRKLGMTFGETPWVARLRLDIWDQEARRGIRRDLPRPDLTVIWMPTLKAGDRPVPRAGVMGFSVMKQTPYKGDAHTQDALRAALYLTHPVHLTRSQLRKFRHLPPEPERFGKMFPELIDNSDQWVRFYNDVINSDAPRSEAPMGADTPGLVQYQQLRQEFDRWLDRTGIGYLQEVIYQRCTPEEGAHKFFEDLKGLPEK
jgi:ABC-type glycerol-3-phosphate transport system substrate-binding protein